MLQFGLDAFELRNLSFIVKTSLAPKANLAQYVGQENIVTKRSLWLCTQRYP